MLHRTAGKNIPARVEKGTRERGELTEECWIATYEIYAGYGDTIEEACDALAERVGGAK